MSKTVNFQTTGGKDFSFTIPEQGKVDSYFLFSLPKAGSTLLMQVMVDVNKKLGIPMVDLPTRLFTLGINPAELKDDINCLWKERGYAYLGFRLFLPTMSFDFSKTRNILLIRDPRDLLVSLYFSVRYSHRIPKLQGEQHPLENARKSSEKIGIDQFVLNRAPGIMKSLMSYKKQLPSETTRVYRYEDIIFKKSEWIEDMLDFLGLYLPRSEIREIAEQHDIRPGVEDPSKHIRQVTPGNYRAHLSQATIDKLDDILGPVMHGFHYDSVISFKMSADERGESTQNLQSSFAVKDNRIRRLEHNLDSMLQSWSWRSTKPLRRIASLFRGK